MSLYSDPPPLVAFRDDKPRLLVCWWITIFCAVIILLRVCGRFVRSERLFTEDKVAALAVIPLCLRMGCVHVILTHGTNNAQLADVPLSDEDIRRKSIASGLVLLSRIFYAATLWILKNTILEFFRRLNVSWERSYVITLKFIRWTLVATFIAIIISDLAECQPFSHYWQVLPDPGGQCRQGYAQLLTMAVCNVITDLLLVLFPIPIILQSGMNVKRKTQLILLFSLSLAVVATTLYRVPHIIQNHGSQSSRSLYASVELLFATGAANALVLGSFVRDRGVKKKRFKYGSVAAGSMERPPSGSRRPTTVAWGSLEDLARDTGFGVKSELREPESAADRPSYQPAPVMTVAGDMNQWQFPAQKRTSAAPSDDSLHPHNLPSRSSIAPSPRRVSFFDVGGLLDDQNYGRRESYASNPDPLSTQGAPSLAVPASSTGLRRGSTAFLQDIGGIITPTLSPSVSRTTQPKARNSTELHNLPRSSHDVLRSQPAYPGADGKPELVLMDPGGLLDQS